MFKGRINLMSVIEFGGSTIGVASHAVKASNVQLYEKFRQFHNSPSPDGQVMKPSNPAKAKSEVSFAECTAYRRDECFVIKWLGQKRESAAV
jgi:hypothetical protein